MGYMYVIDINRICMCTLYTRSSRIHVHVIRDIPVFVHKYCIYTVINIIIMLQVTCRIYIII